MNSTALPITESELLACCGSREWTKRMMELQPFDSGEDLLNAADRVWWKLDRADWLEAFAAHPRIGEKSADQRAAEEQSGVRGAREMTLDRLAAGNRDYEARFGYIYIVCASGKSAEEMLGILESRLRNSAEEEIRVAAEQQRQITHLRLRKWLDAR
jgi:OHCU decarboxylase